MKDFDVLVAGEINPDLILSDPNIDVRFGQRETLVENAALTIGSSSAIFACGAARLGLKVALIGVVGDDLFGQYMLDALEKRGVNVEPSIIDRSRNTGFGVILSRGEDRAILTYLGAINALRAEQVKDALLQRARHLHVGSYYLQTALQPGLPGLFGRARQLGLTTSLDPNWDPVERWSGIAELRDRMDLFFSNEAEALVLTGAPTPELALAQLAGEGKTAAVKLGSAGGMAQRGHATARIPALDTDIADTVGAGDSFDAGFVFGFLQGWSLRDCLALAVACGSLSTRAHGGTAAQPTLEEARSALKQRGVFPLG